MKHLKAQQGFTLLEVILAISILATIGIMTVNILSGQIMTRQKVTEINTQNHVLDMAMTKLVTDLRGAFLRIDYGDGSGNFNVNKRTIDPLFVSSERGFILTTVNNVSYVKNTPQSNLAIIRYFKRADPSAPDAKQLVRVVDTDMIENIENQGVGVTEVLIDDLESFKLEFWDGRKFAAEWNSQVNETVNKLPKMVKIHLGIYFPESAVTKQIRSLAGGGATPKEDRKLLSLETIVYLTNTAGADEAYPPDWSEYKWQ